MIGKRLINTGVAAADALVPSENFNTVLYTGNGSTQRIGGYINRGAIFNGSSSYIDLGNNSSNNGSLISVSCWFRTTSTSAGTIWNNGGQDSSSTGLALSTTASGVLYFQANTNTTFVNDTGTTAVNDGNWHHVVVNYDNGDFNVYLDGNSTPELTGTSTAFTTTANQNFLIGRFSRVATSYFNGVIDQFRIFNRELTTSEVTTLYGETHASSTISTTDIFSDNSGVALYQLDGNANDTGGASGKFGSAAIFNGSSNTITTSLGNSQLPVTGTWSCSCWVNWSNFTSSHVAFGMEDSSSPFYGWSLYIASTGTAYPMVNGNALTGNGQSLSANQWYHIAFTYSGSVLKFYVNNSQVGSDISTSISAPSANFELGDLGFYSNFYGKIDDVRLYSDVLTSTEVGYIYNNTTASIPTDNLVAYYKLDGDARDEQQLYDGTATNVTYAYDGTATNVTYQEATKFQPDLVWIKNRDAAVNHKLLDSIRHDGTNIEVLEPNTDSVSTGTTQFSSFDSNGFTLGGGASVYNGSGVNYAAWCFKGGGTAVSNTDGTVTSSVSANQDAGFSIATYAGVGYPNSSTAEVGHGLNSTPELVIIKGTGGTGQSGGAGYWVVGTGVLASNNWTGNLYLNSTNAYYTAINYFWNGSPTDTVVKLKNDWFVNGVNNTYVMYSWHSVEGYSKVGSYTGTGAAGNMVETGFEPAFVMIKLTSAIDGQWVMYDNKRSELNPRTKKLAANSSVIENDTGLLGGDTVHQVNFLSNGFELLQTGTSVNTNKSGETYIYYAIAADPDTTTPTVENSFDVVTYDGNSGTQDINTDFKPDLVWIKSTDTATSHVLNDSVRGLGKNIYSNLTSAEGSTTGGVTSYNENGITITNDYGQNLTNTSGRSYVAWCWKAGDHDDNLPQINTEGSIDSVVSVNAEAGFSIVKHANSGSTSSTVGHGLSQAPELYITKKYDATTSWWVYTTAIDGSMDYIQLNGTGVKSNASINAPTSTVFYNESGGADGANYITYCFHSVTGYQKIGSYTGSGSSDVSVTTGFRPRFVMIKRTDVASQSNPSGGGTAYSNWFIWDSTRDNTNPSTLYLMANEANAENSNLELDFDSNGFTVGGLTTGGYWAATNASGGTYIYLAIK